MISPIWSRRTKSRRLPTRIFRPKTRSMLIREKLSNFSSRCSSSSGVSSSRENKAKNSRL